MVLVLHLIYLLFFYIYIYTGDDLRANPFEERRNDVILASILKDPL
jgi:hypothetical protein